MPRKAILVKIIIISKTLWHFIYLVVVHRAVRSCVTKLRAGQQETLRDLAITMQCSK